MATPQKIASVLLDMRYLANSPLTGDNDKKILDNYERDLADIEPGLLDAAARHYKNTERFFPQPGALRQKAMELMVDAMDIPTATEAWGYVLTAVEYLPSIDCESGHELRRAIDGKAGGEYWTALHNLKRHQEDCAVCTKGGYHENYRHPAVAETVRLLGGRDILLTDNQPADRARFIEAYNEIIGREKKRAIMHSEVKEFVDSTRAMIEDHRAIFETGEKREFAMQNIRQITDGMEK
jgi:hypothetical protein